MYGYIDNLRRFIVPDVVLYNDEIVENPSDTILAELGYLKLVETERPGNNYVPYYIENRGQALQCWELEPDPTELEAIDARLTYVEMMTGLLEV